MHFLTIQDSPPHRHHRQDSSSVQHNTESSVSSLQVAPSEIITDTMHSHAKLADSEAALDKKQPQEFSWTSVALDLLRGSKLNLLLIAVPIAVFAEVWHWSSSVVFFACVFGLIPLAAMLGDCTEQLALHTNQTVGGLLNATFGNATELILSIFALKNGMLRIIQVSLLGSIISNMLLVLGSSFIVGGYRFKVQTFNKHMITTNSGLLLLAVIGLVFPAVLNMSGDDRDDVPAELILSRGSAILLLLTYCAYIAFQLKTHRFLFEDEDKKETNEEAKGALVQKPDQVLEMVRDESNQGTQDEEDEEDDEEEQKMTLAQSIVFLGIVTGLVALLSEFAVGAIEGAAAGTGLPQIFIGAIILPIVGNAAEHTTAITVAYKNKMTLSLGVAIGSSTQIALFGIPFMVILSWMVGQPLSMYFHAYETSVVFSSVVILSFVVSDGKSTWLKGLMLLVAYLIVALGFFVHKDN